MSRVYPGGPARAPCATPRSTSSSSSTVVTLAGARMCTRARFRRSERRGRRQSWDPHVATCSGGWRDAQSTGGKRAYRRSPPCTPPSRSCGPTARYSWTAEARADGLCEVMLTMAEGLWANRPSHWVPPLTAARWQGLSRNRQGSQPRAAPPTAARQRVAGVMMPPPHARRGAVHSEDVVCKLARGGIRVPPSFPPAIRIVGAG